MRGRNTWGRRAPPRTHTRPPQTAGRQVGTRPAPRPTRRTAARTRGTRDRCCGVGWTCGIDVCAVQEPPRRESGASGGGCALRPGQEVVDHLPKMNPSTGRPRGLTFAIFKGAACVQKILDQEHRLGGHSMDPQKATVMKKYSVKKIFAGYLNSQSH
ncbi:uncharacterized protein LOC117087355 [Trachypithecus francoisi]|uniref:uncharacterized protein LOC117087355 n=1 Tax=Trachypithecus francoisi TaxID=54180 RepID=UPI00141B62AB|nr:uncharacterized protein LOC117087355 [Trachypithecus francoisi]